LAGARSKKELMGRIYDRLGKVYGKRRRTNFGTTFEQLILTILASEAKEPQAIRALTFLQEEYVDWNEVRISPEDILEEDLKKAGVNSSVPVLLKNALEGLLLELSTLKPEILDDLPPQQVRAILKKINLPKSLCASLLLTRAPLPAGAPLPIDSGVARVMVRAGFVKSARSKNEIDRRIRMLLPEEEVHNFHRVVGRLSQEYCFVGEPHCARCPVRQDCRRYKREVSSGRGLSAAHRAAGRLHQRAVSRRSRHPSPKR